MLELDKIYNMDCLEGIKELEDNIIDLIITDPPYYLPINSYVGKRGEGYKRRTLADTSCLKGYFERVFDEVDRIVKPEGTYYIFCDAQSYPIFYQAMFPVCKHVRLLIWDKLVSYNGYTWRHQHELIAWGEKEKAERIKTGDGDIIKCRGVLQKDRLHPAEKPIEVVKKLILKHKKSDNTLVLDLYSGSGTVAAACKQIDVRFLGFELDKNNYDISLKRLLNSPIKLEEFQT